ncbi:MAG: hypothetical protein KME11_21960 [Timaviella obliquedivisa GSE-PSE-MK23-08B]|nr:hypothetical protein [Timaviella obliquedivisa GSE-PSE-MK23-08B]
MDRGLTEEADEPAELIRGRRSAPICKSSSDSPQLLALPSSLSRVDCSRGRSNTTVP